jgi:hypothetical protein
MHGGHRSTRVAERWYESGDLTEDVPP